MKSAPFWTNYVQNGADFPVIGKSESFIGVFLPKTVYLPYNFPNMNYQKLCYNITILEKLN
ncbi:hypothetical protein GCM10027286_01700 [Virgibacillus ainsalahensis]